MCEVRGARALKRFGQPTTATTFSFFVLLRLVYSSILYLCMNIFLLKNYHKKVSYWVKIYFTNRLFSLLQSSDSIKRSIHYCPSMCCCSSCSSSTVADLAKTLNPWSRAASSSSSWWSKESYGKKYRYSGYRRGVFGPIVQVLFVFWRKTSDARDLNSSWTQKYLAM